MPSRGHKCAPFTPYLQRALATGRSSGSAGLVVKALPVDGPQETRTTGPWDLAVENVGNAAQTSGDEKTPSITIISTSWWFEPTQLKNILVKLDHIPPNRCEHKKCFKPPPSQNMCKLYILNHDMPYMPYIKKKKSRLKWQLWQKIAQCLRPTSRS